MIREAFRWDGRKLVPTEERAPTVTEVREEKRGPLIVVRHVRLRACIVTSETAEGLAAALVYASDDEWFVCKRPIIAAVCGEPHPWGSA